MLHTEQPSRRRGPLLRLIVDLGCWLVGLYAAVLLRFEMSPTGGQLRAVMFFAPLMLVLQALSGEFAGLYRRRWVFGSYEDVVALILSVGVATAAATAFDAVLDNRPVPLSIPIGGGAAAFILMLIARYAWRLKIERKRRSGAWRDETAGESGWSHHDLQSAAPPRSSTRDRDASTDGGQGR